MVNSKVHSLERTRRCSGLRAVAVVVHALSGGWRSQAKAIRHITNKMRRGYMVTRLFKILPFVVMQRVAVALICHQNLTSLALAVQEIIGAQILKMVTWPWQRPFKGDFLWLNIAYLFTKIGLSSFCVPEIMVGDHQKLNDSRNLTTPLSGIVCHPWPSTCYDQPIYQIWRPSPPTTRVWKAIQNVEVGVVWGSCGNLWLTQSHWWKQHH